MYGHLIIENTAEKIDIDYHRYIAKFKDNCHQHHSQFAVPNESSEVAYTISDGTLMAGRG